MSDIIIGLVVLGIVAIGALTASHLKKRKEDKAEVPSDTDTPHVAPSTPHVGSTTINIDYKWYASYDAFTLQTRVFYNGLPEGWDWSAWALAAGRNDPRTEDAGGRSIVPMPAFEDPTSVTDNGEMDLDLGETKTIRLTKGGTVTWVAHAPQYLGTAQVNVGSTPFEGAYLDVSLPAGTHTITLVSGPKQGMRIVVRTPN